MVGQDTGWAVGYTIKYIGFVLVLSEQTISAIHY